MRTLLLIACVVFVQLAQAQTHTGIVKGRVIDAKSFKPLPFATVYMNQTTLGTITNDQGDFLLQDIPVGRYDLVVSYVGYQTYQSRVTVNDTIPFTMSIKMSASSTNLDEILVRAKKDDKWSGLYTKFQRYFFGVSPYSAQCKILNPWVLDFSEDKAGILTAKASLPIEIENLGLGYNVTCHLKEFTAGANVYKINGTYRFVEAQTMDTTLSALWHGRREDVYLGSTRHLLKAIIDNRVEESGFELYRDKSNNPEVIRNSNFLVNINYALEELKTLGLVLPSGSDGQYFVKLPSRTEVHYVKRNASPKVYRNVPYPVSWLEVQGGSVEVNAQGVLLNPNKMTVAGAMSDAHVAELLPLNYMPHETTREKEALAPKKSYSKLAALLEKPYMMTDRPYYYPTDVILFKTYFNYISPVYRDSLSHVMTVDLIDASGKIIQTKKYPVASGTSIGDFVLSNTTQPGDYTLRAYTRWMMNFDKQLIFSKGIKVLSQDQLAAVHDIKPQQKQLRILTEKDEFDTREKITLALEATDFYDNMIAADLSVAVTDIEQAAIPYNEPNILSGYPINKELLPDTSLKTANYLIQYGIDFKGQMVTGKKNLPTSGVLTVYQNNINDVFAIPTDNTGKFHEQLQLMDSVELFIASKSQKGKKGKIIVEEIKDPVPEVQIADAVKLDIFKPADPSKYHVTDFFSTARMLEAVTIEAKKIEKADIGQKHILTDSHLDGDYLRSTNATDLLSAIRGRVPGLRVLYMTDVTTGDVRKFLCFPGVIGFTGAEECLVELDGMVLNGGFGESVADKLAAMSVQEIESVDVLRFGAASSYGARAANGVISIKTIMGEKPGAPRKLDRSKFQVVSLSGYSKAEDFVSPDYSEHTTADDRMDIRTTIYWNPFVITEGKNPTIVSFYAADITTRYRIVVEGVTADGEPVRGEKIIVVRSKK
ncbi:MAG TPA: carboxypeptidase-like regulatory domain-containing protein [Cyclobacteriaceae bacterium]|nr:carboxypeptidase-like regulatory domain-containing protein [Cyclobacteriaceae bacterium]